MNISTADQPTRDNCIMVALEKAGAMIRRYAYACHLDADDLEQECAMQMLQARIPAGVDNEIAYLYGVARMQLKKALARTQYAVSLDEERGDDGFTLYDVVPTKEQIVQEDEQKREALYAALRELPLDHQLYAKEHYKLADFNPLAHDWRELSSYNRNHYRISSEGVRRRIKRELRKHPQLQGLVQRETAVL